MPHYKDGTLAQIGDRVRGAGYNSAAQGYDPSTGIEGIVTEVRPGDSREGACTLTVTYLRLKPVPYYGLSFRLKPDGPEFVLDTEYGDTVGFERVG